MKKLNNVKETLLYISGYVKLKFSPINIRIMSIEETIRTMKNGHSIIRYGDGEFSFIDGREISNYQKYDEKLRNELVAVLMAENRKNLLLCMPETLKNMEICSEKSKRGWTARIGKSFKQYKKYCRSDIVYGNAFVSRPYMIYKDKENCKEWFSQILSLFDDKEFVLIEGCYSRSGVGNNLFSKAKSVQRILCPPTNAYDKYDEILSEAKKIPKNKIILLAVGPTSKPLAYELFKEGYIVWDIGHIDSEYEWFLSNTNEKMSIRNKHTAETADDASVIGECNDADYVNSIIARIY